MPLPLNPVPVIVTCEMVAFALPGLVMVTSCVPLLPTVTLPKLTLAGLALTWPVFFALPLPPRCTPCGELESLAVRVISPLDAPTDDGAKVTVNEPVAPAARVCGSVKPAML